MKQVISQQKEFTGRHMLMILLTFFGIIITVNVIMATYSQTSWTGLVVENSYVASQDFNEKAAEGRAQQALGWKADLEFKPGLVTYRLLDRTGLPVALNAVNVTFRRPSYESEDVRQAMQRLSDGHFILSTNLRDGIWIVETSAVTVGKPEYRESKRVVIKGGVIQ